MRRILFTEIELIDILGCSATRLKLDPNQMVTIMMSDSEAATPVPTVLELMCTNKYETDGALFRLKDSFGSRPCVRIVFLTKRQESEEDDITADSDEFDDDEPCTSRQALQREERRRQRRLMRQMCTVSAERQFSINTEEIVYTIDDGELRTDTVCDFYERFFKSFEYVMPQLIDMHNFCYGNWLPLLSIDQMLASTSSSESEGNPFELFAKLFMKKYYTANDFLGQLTHYCLKSAELSNAVKRHALLKVFQQVRTVFEYITCLEFTVWFFIPRLNQYKDIESLTLDDMDFTEIKTCIQLRSDETRGGQPGQLYVWRDAEHGIKDLLIVAFQLTLAYFCNQHFVVLRNLNSIRDYQCMKYATSAYVQRAYDDTEVDWQCHNYVQRIVDTCISLDLNTFIEYPGGLPQCPPSVNLIKCSQNEESAWSLNVTGPVNNFNIEELFVAMESELFT